MSTGMVAHSIGMVTCVLHNGPVPIGSADKNDDGTYSCHDCQEKGVQRPRKPE